MSRSSSRFNKQNERIRALEKQLEATERALANQKWILDRYLDSPSWRMTAPLRWVARQLRSVLSALHFGSAASTESADFHEDAVAGCEEGEDRLSQEEEEALSDWKELFSAFQKLQLQSLLACDARLQLPHSSRPEISIILVTFNRAELTYACLRTLAEISSIPIEVIIVDNASTDETDRLLDRVDGACIIRNRENRNFLLSVNQGAAEAAGDYILIFNNDTLLMTGALEAALKTIKSSPDIGAVGGRIINLDGDLQEAGSIVWRNGFCLGYGRGDDPFAPMYMFRRDVDYCSGCFLLTPRSIWERLGGFDERYKPAYYEETDYCMRLWEQGLRVVYEPNAVILHYEFASSASMKNAIALQVDHQKVFASRHQASLAHRYAPDQQSILLARMRDRGRKRILVIDDRVPHPWLGSGFPRARAILQSLLNQDHFVTFYPLYFAEEGWASVYSDMPVEVEFMTGYGVPMLEAFLRNRRGYYTDILVSRPHNMKFFRPILEANPEWFQDVTLIYDAEALFASRDITLRALSGTPLSPEEANLLVKEEVDLAATADCVISVSEHESSMFRTHGVERVHVLGHTIPLRPGPRPFNERDGILFVGAIHHEATPNGDAVIWFLSEVLPLIKAGLGTHVPFTIVGVNQSDRIRQLADDSVRILGYLKDLDDLYDAARIFVAPTRYAAGIPHKVHEAAARGLPVIATPLLATQLGWKDVSTFAVGSDAETFAQKCIELYSDETRWSKMRAAGLERVRAECSQSAFDAQLKEILGTAQARFADVGMDR